MEDIPAGFLKLPDVEYLSEEPKEPYQFPTSGMLHSSKFVKIMKSISNNEFPDIYKIMDGHRLERILDKMDILELSDFCRHVFVVNRDKIGWQVVDKYLDLLDKKTGLASWKRVDLVFIEEFNHFFSTLIKWDFNYKLTELMTKFVESPLRLSLSDENVIERLNSNYQFWKARELWILFEDFVFNLNSNPDKFQPYRPLLDSLLEIFSQEISKSNLPIIRKVSFLVILSRGYTGLTMDRIHQLHDISERTWIQLGNELDATDYKSYRYLYAIIYGHIGRKYYQSNLTFVHKRHLLNRMIESYFQFDNISMEEWLNQVVMAETELHLKVFILSGINTILHILNEFALELVDSRKLDDIKNRVISMASNLYAVSIELLLFELNLNSLDHETIYRIEQIYSRKEPKTKSIQDIIDIITSSFQFIVYYNHTPLISIDTIEINASLKKLNRGETLAELYKRHLELITGYYPIDNILAKIEYETRNTNSIINSFTFEKEIIQLASAVMEEIKRNYDRNNRLLIIEMHQLYYFIAHLLQVFRKIDLYQDVLMVCSPILSIVQVQLIQAYYEQNHHTMAFIEYLAMQHFASVVRNEMDVVGSKDHQITISYLAEDMREMIQEWRIPEITNIRSIAEKIRSMQFNLTNNNIESEGMIDDDILLGFLELTTKMENAIEASNDGIELHELSSILYEPPSSGIHLFQRIGYRCEDILKVPLLRNPKQMNAALSVIPLTVSLSGDMVDLDISSLLEYFLKVEDL